MDQHGAACGERGWAVFFQTALLLLGSNPGLQHFAYGKIAESTVPCFVFIPPLLCTSLYPPPPLSITWWGKSKFRITSNLKRCFNKVQHVCVSRSAQFGIRVYLNINGENMENNKSISWNSYSRILCLLEITFSSSPVLIFFLVWMSWVCLCLETLVNITWSFKTLFVFEIWFKMFYTTKCYLRCFQSGASNSLGWRYIRCVNIQPFKCEVKFSFSIFARCHAKQYFA